MKAAIIINTNASQGKSLYKWERVKPAILDIIPYDTIINYTNNKSEVKKLVHHLLFEGKCNVFIGAGGDGTINFILNQLIEITGNNLNNIVLGGIGLGSSNDFHKPFGKRINRIPVRLDFNKIVQHDIGQLDYSDKSRSEKRTFFILNSNLGITANANHFFNAPNRILSFLKRTSTPLSIIYASLYTLFKINTINISARIPRQIELSNLNNLSIVKSPFISGSFCYPELVTLNDEKFGIYSIKNMTKLQLVKTMVELVNKKFIDSDKREKYTSETVEIRTEGFINIECDGEVYYGQNPKYTISKSQIEIAGSGY